MKAKRFWILVGDASRAQIFEAEGKSGEIHPVEGGTFENADLHRHARDVGSDRPGRGIESVGGARHAQEPRADLHRQEKAKFAKLISNYMEVQARENRFDSLVLIAPPQMLGEFRGELGKHAEQRIVSEIHKDLTKLPPAELTKQLHEILYP